VKYIFGQKKSKLKLKTKRRGYKIGGMRETYIEREEK